MHPATAAVKAQEFAKAKLRAEHALQQRNRNARNRPGVVARLQTETLGVGGAIGQVQIVVVAQVNVNDELLAMRPRLLKEQPRVYTRSRLLDLARIDRTYVKRLDLRRTHKDLAQSIAIFGRDVALVVGTVECPLSTTERVASSCRQPCESLNGVGFRVVVAHQHLSVRDHAAFCANSAPACGKRQAVNN